MLVVLSHDVPFKVVEMEKYSWSMQQPKQHGHLKLPVSYPRFLDCFYHFLRLWLWFDIMVSTQGESRATSQ